MGSERVPKRMEVTNRQASAPADPRDRLIGLIVGFRRPLEATHHKPIADHGRVIEIPNNARGAITVVK